MIRWLPAKQEKRLGQNPRVTILKTDIDVLDREQTVQIVDKYIRKNEPLHLMGVNADKINEINRNPQLRQIVNSCGVINADGISVVKASRFLGKPLPERVAGIDLMMDLIGLCAEKGYRVFLLGARRDVVEKTADVLKSDHPDLIIAGTHDGYFSREEWKMISTEIENATPDIVFVGITSPKKEYLIEYLQARGHRAVFMGVGGSFDVISGQVRRAPKWMQTIGLEWLFRMLQEPGRLFKRYFIGNIAFIVLVLRGKWR